ncbi:MAG: hypothetical protein RLZ27_390, partial [Pseudomonadota bacterium]
VVASKTTGQLELQESFPDQLQYVELNNIAKFAEIISNSIQLSSNQKTYNFDSKYSWNSAVKKLVELAQFSVQN